MFITEFQKQIMRHTIGGYKRNWFGTDKGSVDAVEFDKLVKGGLATREPAPSWSGDDFIYRLTDDGKFIARC